MRGYSAIGLHNPKFNVNVGSVLRACDCYDVSLLAVSGIRYKQAATDTPSAWKHIPFIRTEDLHSIIPYGCIPVAVDLLEDAIPLPEFVHPERAFYIFGAEDATLGKKVTDWCKYKVYVPTKHCMNLAATVNVVLYDRMAKQRKISNV